MIAELASLSSSNSILPISDGELKLNSRLILGYSELKSKSTKLSHKKTGIPLIFSLTESLTKFGSATKAPSNFSDGFSLVVLILYLQQVLD